MSWGQSLAGGALAGLISLVGTNINNSIATNKYKKQFAAKLNEAILNNISNRELYVSDYFFETNPQLKNKFGELCPVLENEGRLLLPFNGCVTDSDLSLTLPDNFQRFDLAGRNVVSGGTLQHRNGLISEVISDYSNYELPIICLHYSNWDLVNRFANFNNIKSVGAGYMTYDPFYSFDMDEATNFLYNLMDDPDDECFGYLFLMFTVGALSDNQLNFYKICKYVEYGLYDTIQNLNYYGISQDIISDLLIEYQQYQQSENKIKRFISKLKMQFHEDTHQENNPYGSYSMLQCFNDKNIMFINMSSEHNELLHKLIIHQLKHLYSLSNEFLLVLDGIRLVRNFSNTNDNEFIGLISNRTDLLLSYDGIQDEFPPNYVNLFRNMLNSTNNIVLFAHNDAHFWSDYFGTYEKCELIGSMTRTVGGSILPNTAVAEAINTSYRTMPKVSSDLITGLRNRQACVYSDKRINFVNI
ncbi:MAG: hypothetical protein LBM93_03415 [Oscillospiraceae bacterium]|jgi:hypothetical protein|nr:hypothetical protein [Oscillospiraceae bacterium]